jgi:DNA-binding CsgD family transcriptional regulator
LSRSRDNPGDGIALTWDDAAVDRTDSRARRGLLPLLAVSLAIVLVALGLGRGLWVANLHNGLLAIAFTFVGAYVAVQRPGHREATLFLATGLVEAVMFLGRQIGHEPTSSADRWLGWLGVWPLAGALALTTLAIIGFPDGRLPSPAWRPVAIVVVVLAAVCSALSALWPVEYASSGIVTPHPFAGSTPELAKQVWSALAHPAYAAFQVLWLVAVAVRWRTADRRIRRQLLWLAGAASLSLLALATGMAIGGTHVPGVLAATLLPLAAGWAILHEQHVTAYAALSWLSRAGATSEDLPTAIATTAAEALSSPGATLWMGSPEALHAIGVWPSAGAGVATTTPEQLRADGGEVRDVLRDGETVGALSVKPRRAGALTLAESRLLDDLAAQAAWVIEHVGLARIVTRERDAGHLGHLTPRENDVLGLMARGLTNQAICAELHLSLKTVEPIVGTIFSKLELHADRASNRRVLAVLAYLRARHDGESAAHAIPG